MVTKKKNQKKKIKITALRLLKIVKTIFAFSFINSKFTINSSKTKEKEQSKAEGKKEKIENLP